MIYLDDEPDFQKKLLEIWNILELSMDSRIAFMRKYSTLAYADLLNWAIDLWGEIAVFIVARKEILKFKVKFDVSVEISFFII